MNDFHQNALQQLAHKGRLRTLKPLTGRNGCRIVYKGREMLNLTSNDYLGLAGDKRLLQKFYNGLNEGNILDSYSLGATSSRLLAGDNKIAHQVEDVLQQTYNKEACLLFNSGYHANIGILPALFGKGDLILSDKLNHASIMDGMGLCLAEHKRYRHCDYDHLAGLLEEHRQDYRQVVIISESVFSMDGDVADLKKLVALKNQYDTTLYIDEAHGIGLYGTKGLGMAEQQGQLADVDLLVGTFGKALASIGAFLLCSNTIREYLINYSRSLIFTTALPPVVHSWNLFMFQEMLCCGEKRDLLKSLAASLRQQLNAHALITDGSTNIVPVRIGDDSLTVALAEAMQDMGYLIFPIRPPAVPEGTARFRLSLTADMTWADIAPLAAKIAGALRRD